MVGSHCWQIWFLYASGCSCQSICMVSDTPENGIETQVFCTHELAGANVMIYDRCLFHAWLNPVFFRVFVKLAQLTEVSNSGQCSDRILGRRVFLRAHHQFIKVSFRLSGLVNRDVGGKRGYHDVKLARSVSFPEVENNLGDLVQLIK